MNDARHADGTFAETSFAAVYAEIKRLDQLRSADQLATVAALAAAEKAVAAALAASDKAVAKAEEGQLRVNTTQNEFRGALNDQSRTLMPRGEAESLFRELRGIIDEQTKTIDILRGRIDNTAGRSSGTAASWAYLIAGISIVIAAGTGLLGVIVFLTQ